MSIATTILGYPRIGAKRELKRAQEAYWKGKSSISALQDAAARVRQSNYAAMLEAGVTEIPVGDFSFYDHVLNTICMLRAIPQRYQDIESKLEQPLDLFFAMARGRQQDGIDVAAMEMTKWFDTNYHNIVPELVAGQKFQLDSSTVKQLLQEAQNTIGTKAKIRPVVLGPVSFLLLSKGLDQPLQLLDTLLAVYQQLLAELAEYQQVQIEEPFLALDLDDAAKEAYRKAYGLLASKAKLFVSSYFAPLRENAELVVNQGIATLHLDLINHSQAELNAILGKLPEAVKVSAGIVNGRNIWRNKLGKSLALLQNIVDKIGPERLIVSSSCSLLHSPVDLRHEQGHLQPEVYQQLAFARQKLDEIVTLAKGLDGQDITQALEVSNAAIEDRKSSSIINNPSVQQRVSAISPKDTQRNSVFSERRKKQVQKLGLPLFPTTTIGSFPQTAEVRKKRSACRKGEISQQQYHDFLEQETQKCIQLQQDLGLDVLVHGEFERTDMVEYFGEQLSGLAFTSNGWVQSYGSRCVRPPVIYGDIARAKAMTVDWMTFAQQLLGQYRTPFQQLLTEQLGGNGPSPTKYGAEPQPEDGTQEIAPTQVQDWMLLQFSAPPITFEGKGNQRGKGVMKQDPNNHDITFSMEKLKENMQAIQQQFETEAKHQLEQYFSNCRSNIEQNYSAFMQEQSQQAHEQMRNEILASVHRVEEQLEQQQQEFDSLQNELNKL